MRPFFHFFKIIFLLFFRLSQQWNTKPLQGPRGLDFMELSPGAPRTLFGILPEQRGDISSALPHTLFACRYQGFKVLAFWFLSEVYVCC